MTDYLNPHKIYIGFDYSNSPDFTAKTYSDRVDIPPGLDSVRDCWKNEPPVKESLTTECEYRKPRLSAEQIEHLKALNLLGYKYLYLSHCGYCYASTTESILTGTTAELPNYRALKDLLKAVKIPLNIVQTLKDAGVEV